MKSSKTSSNFPRNVGNNLPDYTSSYLGDRIFIVTVTSTSYLVALRLKEWKLSANSVSQDRMSYTKFDQIVKLDPCI
jgi:hypothetical protein